MSPQSLQLPRDALGTDFSQMVAAASEALSTRLTSTLCVLRGVAGSGALHQDRRQWWGFAW